MHDDDVYANSGETYQDTAYYPKAPQEQVEAEQKAASVIAASYPIMDEIADWFRAEIAGCNNLDNIALHHPTLSAEVQVMAYQLLKEKLEGKLQAFEQFGKHAGEAGDE